MPAEHDAAPQRLRGSAEDKRRAAHRLESFFGNVRHPSAGWISAVADGKHMYLSTYETRESRSGPSFDVGAPTLRVEIGLTTASPMFN